MTEDATPLVSAVRAASRREDVVRAVGEVYTEVGSAVDARRPRCDVSGRCCRFEDYGHRLYVTTLELAVFVATPDAPLRRDEPRSPTDLSPFILPPSSPPWDGTGCPFQRARLCTVHVSRPFGCRMFFCDPTSTEWQNEAYERFHARLTQMHKELGVQYFYVEWRAALCELGLAAANAPSTPESKHPREIPD